MSDPDERFSFYILAAHPRKYLNCHLVFTIHFIGRSPYESNYTWIINKE